MKIRILWLAFGTVIIGSTFTIYSTSCSKQENLNIEFVDTDTIYNISTDFIKMYSFDYNELKCMFIQQIDVNPYDDNTDFDKTPIIGYNYDFDGDSCEKFYTKSGKEFFAYNDNDEKEYYKTIKLKNFDAFTKYIVDNAQTLPGIV